MVETDVDGINNECDESLDRDRRSSLYQCQAPFSLSSIPSLASISAYVTLKLNESSNFLLSIKSVSP